MSILIDEIQQDILAAQQALATASLSMPLSNASFLCEVYHRPAHNNRSTMYAKFYSVQGHIYTVYTKAEMFLLGWHIKKESFEAAKEANLHGGSEGRIICGVRYINSIDENSIRQASHDIVFLSIPKKNAIILDDEPYYVSSDAGHCLFMHSSLDLDFDGKEMVAYFVRLIDSIIGN